MQSFQHTTNFLLILSCTFLVYGIAESWDGCNSRLERALDTLHQDSARRIELEEEKSGINYQQRLKSIPFDMTVSHIMVKFLQNSRSTSDRISSWAKVEQCVYKPSDNSLHTRVVFHDLTIFGTVSLIPRNHQASVLSESCRMILRFQKCGIEFFTSPIARRKGQMKIRTESSFLEPRFASMYAHACNPDIRGAKQIKRQDKWSMHHEHYEYHSHFHGSNNEFTGSSMVVPTDSYEMAEPRYLVDHLKEDATISSEPQRSDTSEQFLLNDKQLRKKDSWISKLPISRGESSIGNIWISLKNKEGNRQLKSIVKRITPQNFASAAVNSKVSKYYSSNPNTPNSDKNFEDLTSVNDTLFINDTVATHEQTNSSMVTELNWDRKNPHGIVTTVTQDVEQKLKMLPHDKNAEIFVSNNRNWQSKEYITKEMEDVFVKSASQALTRYIERKLHPAIKETLMLSMGYTISYG